MSKIKTLYHRVLLSFNKALVFSKKKKKWKYRVPGQLFIDLWESYYVF